jgi:LuxR family maltose regulon positive regulatory protein
MAALLGLLDRLNAAATSARRDGSLLEIRVLQALVHQAHGDLPRALAALGRAIGESPEPGSHVRLYRDEGAPMITLLEQLANGGDPVAGHEGGEAVRERARRLLEPAHRTTRGADRSASSMDALSQRELDVLRLLDSELTGPEIARQLYITLNTLRTHTKRIRTKLDARTRAAAVRRARERGLL